MTKIVHLITGLNTGGAETMLSRLLSMMDPARFTNVVVSMTDEGTVGRRIRSDGISLYVLGIRSRFPNPISIWSLVRILREEKPAVLQTWLYHADLLGLIAGGLSGVPAIAWNIRCSQVEMQYYSKSLALILRLLGYLSSRPQAVVVNSETGRNVHKRLNYQPRKWEVIPNGFDLNVFRPDSRFRIQLSKELGVAADAFMIGLVARYDPMKDHRTFLEAARLLLVEHPNVAFVLVGRGVCVGNRELTSLSESLQISHKVHLLGERVDIENIIPGLDLACLSSAFGEGFPNVIGEAMACGVPCVVTDIGDSARIVGDTGRVVPAKHPEALAKAWDELIRLGPDHRRELGLAARRRIQEHYSLPAIVAQYEKLYEELTAGVRD